MADFETQFQKDMMRLALLGGDKVLIDAPNRTLRGTVMETWLRSIADDQQRIPHCAHYERGGPGVLWVDDEAPQVRCQLCSLWEHFRQDARVRAEKVCRLCGTEPADGMFIEFIIPAPDGLLIVGHCCVACRDVIGPGVPA